MEFNPQVQFDSSFIIEDHSHHKTICRNLYAIYLLGLQHDDTLHETPEVKEALRRLPKKLQDERQFRISRALYLSMRKEVLPKPEWTKYEEVTRLKNLNTNYQHMVVACLHLQHLIRS